MEVKEVTAKQAFESLKDNKNTVLVDVRSDAEFAFVGHADLSSIDGNMILLPWKMFPNMNLNGRFQLSLEKKLAELFADDAKKAELIFMCRSGARSFEAACYMKDFGYENCFNLINGFEGSLDSNGHRGNVNGWKMEKLPWRQQ